MTINSGAVMSQVARFAISTPSRHPANQHGYDPDRHRYRPEYVNPPHWEINLFAAPNGITEAPNGGDRPPDDIVRVHWTVDQVDGAFTRAVSHGRSKSMAMLRATVRVPEPGTFDVTLRLDLTDGTSVSSARRYRIRDFLIVSIGDSFAAGQGNPDVPATPSKQNLAMCRLTTVRGLIDTVKTEVLEFLREVERRSGDALITYLPFVGKIAVGTLKRVGDIKSWLNRQVHSLKAATVHVVVDVAVGTIVEGAEEIAGWLGIGDGGESVPKPRPAVWQEPLAYRSYRSGHSLAARQIEVNTFEGADRVTFLSLARSGSEIQDGLLGPRTTDLALSSKHAIDQWTGNRGQIVEARATLAGRPIDALIVSIGVNDLGFSSQVTESILWKSGERRNERINRAGRQLDEMPERLAGLARTIREQLSPKVTLLTEYPIGVFAELENGEPCGILGSRTGFDIDRDEARAMHDLGRRLNRTLRAAADQPDWALVDGIEAGFDGHGYCARVPYFVSAEESCRNQGDLEGTLHPNKRGHDVARDRIADALQRHVVNPHSKTLEPLLHMMMR
jgi:lysophospholipase L1-like esterase